MNEIVIPATEQIITMSLERCKHERMRLKNEISFARGNALWGGPSGEEKIAAYKKAMRSAWRRLCVCGDPHARDTRPSGRRPSGKAGELL